MTEPVRPARNLERGVHPRCAVSRQHGVLVMPARMLAGHLASGDAVYTSEEVAELHVRVVNALCSRAALGHR